MNKNDLVTGIGVGAMAAAGVAMLLRPKKNKQMRRAVKTLGRALSAVPGIMQW